MVDQKDVIRDLAAKANIAATSPTSLRAGEAMLLIMSQLNVVILRNQIGSNFEVGILRVPPKDFDFFSGEQVPGNL